MENTSNYKVYKILSRNDTGETKSHQSGISIPKEIARSSIFPPLDSSELNPRTNVLFFDEDNIKWEFQYIYYNDYFFGKEKSKGHNEYRLTCVKNFMSEYTIIAGDSIWFSIDNNEVKHIGFLKQSKEADKYMKNENNETVIEIKGGWHYIKY